MKKTDLAYIAGIVDGEGCICLTRRKCATMRDGYRIALYVSVGNTNRWLVEYLRFAFGGSIRRPKPSKRDDNYDRKDFYDWRVQNKQALEFLKPLLPYLRIKRPQAELALQFQAGKTFGGYKSAEHKAIEEAQRILVSQYNQRGGP